MKKVKTILILSFILVQSSPVFASRFWLTNVKKEVSPKLISDQLKSLKGKGKNSTGWTLAAYLDGVTLLSRAPKAPSEDAQFDQAVKSVAGNNADLVIGHLTENALACQDGVEPVHRYRNGKSWIFSSSGGIGKDLFVKLIGDDYLKANPPIMCGDHPESWMESELYFIYLLKHIQEAGDVQKGLEQAIKGLELAQTEVQGGDRNFYLTDGTDLWIYRKGSSIYYTFKEREQMPMISSDKLGGKWQEIPQDTLTRVQPSEQPTFHALSKE